MYQLGRRQPVKSLWCPQNQKDKSCLFKFLDSDA